MEIDGQFPLPITGPLSLLRCFAVQFWGFENSKMERPCGRERKRERRRRRGETKKKNGGCEEREREGGKRRTKVGEGTMTKVPPVWVCLKAGPDRTGDEPMPTRTRHSDGLAVGPSPGLTR
ncbi:hypothetical protein CRG98_017362 [Punica granatum]|uniref:Uncharacterized protein n=1 Tax=Punica granatum TaxID=22663 RepID=A0A2I0K0Z6_PUNGR|nr:hypothetical protein CRG98_017362 [Punica granatum]